MTNSGEIDLLDSESAISGDFTQTGTGTLAITLLAFGDYPAAPLGIVGDASIDGELLLDLDPGFAFSALDRLTLIDAGGTRTGTFSNYADGALVYAFGSRRRMYLEYTADGVALYTTPLPGTWALIGLGLFGWGAARSGTTLLEQVLCSHPRVHGAGELRDFVDVVREHPATGDPVDAAHWLPRLTDAHCREIGAEYLTRLRAHDADALRITDKMPGNYHYLGLIARCLPSARIIHSMRDPMDSCLSNYTRLFNHTMEFA